MARKIKHGSEGTYKQHNQRMTSKVNTMKTGTPGTAQKKAISSAMGKTHRVG